MTPQPDQGFNLGQMIGRLESKIDALIRRDDERHTNNTARLDELEEKVTGLWDLKGRAVFAGGGLLLVGDYVVQHFHVVLQFLRETLPL
jgi:hypothetical protein